MTEDEIRRDERAKILQGMQLYASGYIEKWGPTVGMNRAKADAWNIIVAAKRVCGPPVQLSGEPNE